MSTYNKDAKRSGSMGKEVKITVEKKFDSGLFKAACFAMVIGFPCVAGAVTWAVPGLWEITLYDGNHHGGPINWGMGFLAILLSGFALYPWCYSTLLFTWSIWGKPNKARAAEQIGGIHLTHFGLIWFWLTFVGPGVYLWWGGMFGIGMEPEGWYWALFIPALMLTGIAVQGLFWGLYLLFRGTPAARDHSETQSKLENRIVEQATKSGEVVTKPLKNWWED